MRDYNETSGILNSALMNGQLLEIISGLEEFEKETSSITLELRDHIFHYLGMWDIYFAVQISSIDVLRILEDNNIRENPQVFMIDFIRDLFIKNDNRFDQFCVNIQTISHGHYAILVQPIIEKRTEELLRCKIPYLEGSPTLYSAADLLSTYYGSRIVSAAHSHRQFDIVLTEEEYETVRVSLEQTGFDISNMLQQMNSDEWEKYVKRRRMARDIHTGSDRAQPSGRDFSELIVLRRVKSARSNIYSDIFERQDAALRAIQRSGTQRCNDVLMGVASDPSHPMRKRVIYELGAIGDASVLEFLGTLMKRDGDPSVRREAARAYSTLSSRATGIQITIPSSVTTPPELNIATINKSLNDLIDKGMPITMIEELLDSVARQGRSQSIDIFLRLLRKPHESVRKSIIRASRLLDKPSAALILRTALDDESPDIVRLAENEIDTRWADDVWTW